MPPPPPSEGEEETKFEQRWVESSGVVFAATFGPACSIIEQIQGCLACRQRLKEQAAKGALGGGGSGAEASGEAGSPPEMAKGASAASLREPQPRGW